MIKKIITWLSLILIAVLAVPVILLLFLISVIWSLTGSITAWMDKRRKNSEINRISCEKEVVNMEIRNATIEDLEAISAVEAECFPPAEAASAEDFRTRLENYPDHFWLLWDGSQLVGFVDGMVTDERDLADEMYEKAGMHNENGRWQMIFGVNTIPAYRNRGCAEMLIRRAIDDAKAQGRAGLVLTCKEKLIHYYAKFGFVNEGISGSVHGNVQWYQMRLVF